MRTAGYILLCVGFIIAAYATALDVRAVEWKLFVVAAVAAAAGIILFKRHEKAQARAEHVLEGNRAALRSSIDNLVEGLRDIAGKSDLRGSALRDRIDEQLRPDMTRFADARESMVHLFGLQTYADIMSHFAAGERYVNRVWSASADGYHEEAVTYLGKAATQFEVAQQQLAAATQGA